MSESILLADGSPAPIGLYTVSLEAWDAYGHTGRASGLVIIPAPAAPPAPAAAATPTRLLPPTRTATPTRTNTPTATETPLPTLTATPTSTRAAGIVVVTGPPQEPPETEPLSTPGVLWGAEAAAVSAMVAAYALEIRRKREEEEAQQRAEAERLNAEARQREREYAAYLASLKPPKVNPPVSGVKLTPEQQIQQAMAQTEAQRKQAEAAMFASMTVEERIAWGQSQYHAPAPVQVAQAVAASQPATASQNKSWWEKLQNSVQQVMATTVYNYYKSYMWADKQFDQIYGYHGPANPPTGATGLLMSALPGVSPSSPPDYILKQYQVTQFPPNWPSGNECVTAATIQDMNMMQDILASKLGKSPLPPMDLESFATAWDTGHPLLQVIRPAANIPLVGGMLRPQLAKLVLEKHAEWLQANIGCSYHVELTSGNTVDDLIENLKNGYPTSIHIAYPKSLMDEQGGYLALFGGSPHTVTLAGYDATTGMWQILDPGYRTHYTEWNTQQLMDLWGRQFLFYPPRFAMTTLIPDTVCTPPISTPTPSPLPSPVPMPGQPTPTGTPEP